MSRAPEGGGCLVCIGCCLLGFILGGFTCGFLARNSVRNEAVEAGVAKWELESQENPTAKFVWLKPGGEE